MIPCEVFLRYHLKSAMIIPLICSDSGIFGGLGDVL